MSAINSQLDNGKIEDAKASCDKQKGSVANVIYSGLSKYQDMEKEKNASKRSEVVAIQKEIEESTSLELQLWNKTWLFYQLFLQLQHVRSSWNCKSV